ncbi:ATP-binding domain-containing protein [Pseudofrankia sp. BMG5.37]|uniref:HelD family protein n=1 Tax=Pseudofrankia sp. BMG5.37 TaxID=3050035 RepID=UPI002893B212|nr:ATP-binding domain-containing protein [Pseudofrankia sp. BMG5.37]MDT3445173.1 ATP-binding domain-containing protein [Pseudofrankia sp. BMG5.37]
MSPTRDPRLVREQAYVDLLYTRLDEVRDLTRAQLRQVLLDVGTGTPQAVVERDVFAATHAERLARLEAAEGRLCFGAMDRADGTRTYIGRIGLSDVEQEPILVDWRAPVATAFYQATLAEPRGLVRRRHLRSKGREVTGVADDLLSVGPAGAAPAVTDGAAEADRPTGDTMLLEALSAPRTGRMGDIIATLQAEQDRIIRADARSVLVVDGGPGTGKTAVALHRAAYLLYSERARLERSGVLVVGPSPVFLRYIDQVLPSLGETGVVFATPGRLFPGVAATATDPVALGSVKGDERMAAVLAAAVREHQRLPRRTIEIVHDDDRTLRLDRDTVARARTRARRSRRPHNGARWVFLRELLDELTGQVVRQISGGLLDDDERRDVRDGLWADPAVRRALNELWPRLSSFQLLERLYTDADLLARAAARILTPAERDLLQGTRRPGAAGHDDLFSALDGDEALTPDGATGAGRERGAGRADRGARAWTVADVALLDEAAELLGDPDESSREAAEARAARERAAERRYAEDVLEMLGLAGELDAETVADRWRGPRRRTTAAEQGATDREWAFGHLIVDEAQEVSPMLWRLLWRRCPARSATLVGDLAQAARPGAPATWARILTPHVGDRFRVERLTVNYRTPREIMDVAADVLAASGSASAAPESVRSTGEQPLAVRVPSPGGLPDAVAAETVRTAGIIGEGRLAVICPPETAGPVRAALCRLAPELLGAAGPGVGAGDGAEVLDARVAVLTVADSKGLEFDAVLLVEPSALLAGPTRGLADLYVALTRATRSLTVLHTGALPPVLARLTS